MARMFAQTGRNSKRLAVGTGGAEAEDGPAPAWVSLVTHTLHAARVCSPLKHRLTWLAGCVSQPSLLKSQPETFPLTSSGWWKDRFQTGEGKRHQACRALSASPLLTHSCLDCMDMQAHLWLRRRGGGMGRFTCFISRRRVTSTDDSDGSVGISN